MPEHTTDCSSPRGSTPQRRRQEPRGPANKPGGDEPGSFGAFPEKDPGQEILPGLPRGLLAYQKNYRYLGTVAGGAERVGPDQETAPRSGTDE